VGCFEKLVEKVSRIHPKLENQEQAPKGRENPVNDLRHNAGRLEQEKHSDDQ
jgi:hypothetical protein